MAGGSSKNRSHVQNGPRVESFRGWFLASFFERLRYSRDVWRTFQGVLQRICVHRGLALGVLLPCAIELDCITVQAPPLVRSGDSQRS